MSEILNQYFDFSLMSEHFDQVLNGFWITIQLSLVGGILALTWGLILALMRQLPGRGFGRERVRLDAQRIRREGVGGRVGS